MKLLKPTCRLALAVFFLLAPAVKSSASTIPVVGPQTAEPAPIITEKDKFRLELMRKYSSLTLAEYEKLKGKKLGFLEKTYFKLNQRRMRKFVQHYDGDGPNVLSKISWFFKGLLLGPIAVLLTYLFFKDEERELIKWAWFGFGTLALLVGVYFLFFANK